MTLETMAFWALTIQSLAVLLCAGTVMTISISMMRLITSFEEIVAQMRTALDAIEARACK